MKIIIAFIFGLMIASAIAQTVDKPITVPFSPAKFLAHLDDEELKAIKDACK